MATLPTGTPLYDFGASSTTEQPLATQYYSVVYATMEHAFAPAQCCSTWVRSEPAQNRATQLHLSITTPYGITPGSDAPVVVFIHGGSYVVGSRTESWFDGRSFARHGIILVTCDYRLGAPGFIPFGDDDPNHYRGVDDCATALQWVSKNIEDFGGDPTNITLIGQSAGGGIALWLNRRDHYQGLFRRSWVMSPAFPRIPITARSRQLRWALQVPLTRTGLAKLAKHPQRLHKRWNRFSRRVRADLPAGPAPFDPRELADTPLVLSCTDGELNPMPAIRRIDSLPTPNWIKPRVNKKFGANYSFGWDDPHWFSQLSSHAMIRRFLTQTIESRPSSPHTWLLYYQGTSDQPSAHCDDIPLVFHSVAAIPRSEEWVNRNPPKALVERIHTRVCAFARGEKPDWQPCDPERANGLVAYFSRGEITEETGIMAEVFRNFPLESYED